MSKRILNSELWEKGLTKWWPAVHINLKVSDAGWKHGIPFSSAIAMSPSQAVEHDALLEIAGALLNLRRPGIGVSSFAVSRNALEIVGKLPGSVR